MLSRLLPKLSHFRLLTLTSCKSQSCCNSHVANPIFSSIFRPFCTNHNDDDNNNKVRDQSTSEPWKISKESDSKFDIFFSQDDGNLPGINGAGKSRPEDGSWWDAKEDGGGDVFGEIDNQIGARSNNGAPAGGGVEDEWLTSEEYKPWSLVEEEKVDLFDLGEDAKREGGSRGETDESFERKKTAEIENLEREEKELTAVLKGPNRAFGDLIAASGITDDMLDSLIALKDLEGVEGLPPLSVIEDMRYEKNTRRSSRYEIERQKQEEIAKARVRQVDDKGRAYGTGRRKCSIARVWIQPGNGKFVINDKEFDVYFPLLDHRAALLRPFSETKTLGSWNVDCTVKGGGVSGQVGAIQLGISRALQNWEPDLRPPLKAVGFLTRDSRVVERKKPGKAKARKSFQWVKR